MFHFFDKSDAQLQEDVTSELQWDPAVNSSGVMVSASHGIVTLRGSVPHYIEKMAAELATQRVSGVKAVADELQVNIVNPPDQEDQDIAQAALTAFKWNYSVPNQVKVVVENGWVTLSGEVDWDYQRDAARNAVSDLLGVVGVTNSITLRAQIQPGDVKSKIESALKRAAESDSSHVHVSVAGNRVTLTGTVNSFAEIEQARQAAFKAPGVQFVDNNLMISQ